MNTEKRKIKKTSSEIVRKNLNALHKARQDWNSY